MIPAWWIWIRGGSTQNRLSPPTIPELVWLDGKSPGNSKDGSKNGFCTYLVRPFIFVYSGAILNLIANHLFLLLMPEENTDWIHIFLWTLLLAFHSARRSDGTPAAPAPAPHGILKKREAELDDGWWDGTWWLNLRNRIWIHVFFPYLYT